MLYLNLSKCNLSDDGCEKFSGLRNLKVLNLGFNDISDAYLVHMRGGFSFLYLCKFNNNIKN
ncbi:unnamed protein product [Camellia sinensis]